MDAPRPLLTRYEIARLVGLRSLQLSMGVDTPLVTVIEAPLCNDTLYIAALELYQRKLDLQVSRGTEQVSVREARLPKSLHILLDTKDGGTRARDAFF